jgi:hypothetical protein
MASDETNKLEWGETIPVSEVDVWRAAHLMVKIFDEDASTQAALRSDPALDAGDMKNHRLWLGVMHTVNELQRTKRLDGEILN